MTLIHKGGGKTKDEIGNYRPISIMNILAKVFGMTINEKLMTWAEQYRIWGEEQSGFRKGRGGLENVYVIKEIIERNRKQGTELYLIFLDLEKAFDTVNRQKLMRLLTHIGVDEKIIEVIKQMYIENKMKFTLGNVSTAWLENNVGVRQGCVMSPTLFNIYLEELLVRIRKSGKGVTIGNEKLGCLAYADDVVLMTEKKRDMEDLLEITRNYGKEWDLCFSAKKCKVLEFNSVGKSLWVLGNDVLQIVEKYTYLGIEISKEGIGEEKQRRINEGKARRMAGMIINGGSRQINKYEVGRSLWKGVAVPYCLYGSEITNYREGDFAKLEKIQNIVGRWGLGAPRYTAIEAIRGDMAWSTFKERIIKGKFGFVKKIKEMKEGRWAKKILEEGRRDTTLKREIDKWSMRENIGDGWNNMSLKDIKKKIEGNGLERWTAGMREKSSMKWYRRKQKPEEIRWHVGDWGSKLLFKARTGTLEVKGRNRDDQQDKNCSFCVGEKETIEHLIVECDKYNEQRRRLIDAVITVIGKEEWERRQGEEDGGICTVLGLYGGKEETEKLAEPAKTFLVQCWNIRQHRGHR